MFSARFPARRFVPAVTALWPIAGAFCLLFPAADARAAGLFGCLRRRRHIAVLSAPMAPWTGAPLRVIVAAEKPLDGELSLITPEGRVAAKSRGRQGGPPYFWFAEMPSPAAGTWRATLDGGRLQPDHPRHRRAPTAAAPPPAAGGTWPLRNNWNRATENLYSAWIEKLFDAPLDAEPSWPTLREVLHDRSRNVLFNYLGRGEDEAKIVISPDCADLVYFLRAYFAYKMGLPFGYSKCSRGGGGSPPKCYGWFTNQSPDAAKAGGVVRRISAGGRRRRAVRRRARRRQRRPHRFLYRAAVAADAAPGHRVRRSVRARDGPGAARAAVGRRRRRLPRRRRRARRHGGAQAVLARQFPVCPRTLARQPRLQALPADRARSGRRPAPAEQCRNRQGSAVRRFFAATVAALGRRFLRPHGRRDVAAAARSVPRHEGGDQLAGRASEDARGVGRERPQVPERARRRRRHAGRPGDLRHHRRLGGFRHAGARLPAVDRHRRGALLSG